MAHMHENSWSPMELKTEGMELHPQLAQRGRAVVWLGKDVRTRMQIMVKQNLIYLNINKQKRSWAGIPKYLTKNNKTWHELHWWWSAAVNSDKDEPNDVQARLEKPETWKT